MNYENLQNDWENYISQEKFYMWLVFISTYPYILQKKKRKI